ncbi:hypothetical protein GCM10027067_11480 [Pseudactinotalea suaedae]
MISAASHEPVQRRTMASVSSVVFSPVGIQPRPTASGEQELISAMAAAATTAAAPVRSRRAAERVGDDTVRWPSDGIS